MFAVLVATPEATFGKAQDSRSADASFVDGTGTEDAGRKWSSQVNVALSMPSFRVRNVCLIVAALQIQGERLRVAVWQIPLMLVAWHFGGLSRVSHARSKFSVPAPSVPNQNNALLAASRRAWLFTRAADGTPTVS